MTLIIPLDHALVAHKHRIVGDPEPMIITYGVSTNPAAPNANAIALEAAVAWAACLNTAGSSAVELFETEVWWQNLAPPAAPQVGVATTTQAGSNAGTIVPQNSALLVQKRTAFGGRGGRGRFYVPGVRESIVDNVGVVDSAHVTYWNTALATFLAALVAAADIVSMVVLHDDAGAYAADAPHPVTSLNMDNRIATQRRRLRR